jgi:hypothetical protein
MVERFVEFAGLISIGTGESTVIGLGTAFGGVDREGCQVWVQPAGAACFRIGTVAAVEPRGVYDDLALPLLHPWNGAPVVNQPYELLDHPALANGVSQAAVYARFAAFLERNMGLSGNTADDVDYALSANNSLFVDAVTRTIYQWRNGFLEPVFSVGLQFSPKGAWSNATTYARNDMVVDVGRAFVSNADGNLNHQPPSSSDGDAWWTRLPIAPMAPIEVRRDRYHAECRGCGFRPPGGGPAGRRPRAPCRPSRHRRRPSGDRRLAQRRGRGRSGQGPPVR